MACVTRLWFAEQQTTCRSLCRVCAAVGRCGDVLAAGDRKFLPIARQPRQILRRDSLLGR